MSGCGCGGCNCCGTCTPLIEWVAATPSTAHCLANKAVVGGHEPDCSPLWVIRAKWEGDLVPGKLAIKHKVAYVPWNVKEHSVCNIEVCCANPDNIRWVQACDGCVPPGAVVAGHTSYGENLYVARTHHDGALTPGKVHPSHKVMYMSYGGDELHFKSYEVLCTVSSNTY